MSQEDQLAFLRRAAEPFVADVRRTLDPEFGVDIFLADDGWWTWSTYDSAKSICGTEWEPDEAPVDGLARVVAELADDIPDLAFDDVLHLWPVCPRHGDHPLHPEVRKNAAVWMCRRDRQMICEIGHYDE